MSDAIEIILDHPVECGGTVYRTVTIRPPTKTDLARINRRGHSKYGKGLAVAAFA